MSLIKFAQLDLVDIPPELRDDDMGNLLTEGIEDYAQTWTTRDSSRFWTKVQMSADGKYQLACVDSGTLYISSDFGVTWASKESSRSWSGVGVSADGKYQVAVAGPSQIYVSSDYGATWVARDSSRTWTGVAVSATGKYMTATAGSAGLIYISSDFGVTWASKATARQWGGVGISASGQYQTAWADFTSTSDFIYRSVDYGNTWAVVSGTGDTATTFRNAIDLSADGKYQMTASGGTDQRASIDYGATWFVVQDLVAKAVSGLNGVTMSSDGKYRTGTKIGDNIYYSYDFGVTWASQGGSLGGSSVVMSADGRQQLHCKYNGALKTSTGTLKTNLWLLNLPTTDPLIIGALWNNGGKVNISRGSGFTPNAKRLFETTSTSTLTPEIITYDIFLLTAQAANLTVANHATSVPNHGDMISIEIVPDATPRTLTFGTNYVAKAGLALPTTTVASKRMKLLFEWEKDISKFNLVGLTQEV